MLIMQQWEVASPKYSLCFATEHKRSIYSNRTVSLSVQCNCTAGVWCFVQGGF